MNSIKYANLITSCNLAHEAGFKAVEISVPKLKDFLGSGFKINDVIELLKINELSPVCVNDIFGVESIRPEERRRIISEMEFLAPITQQIGCHTLQVCPLCELEELSWPEIVRLTAKNLRALADMAMPYDIRIQLETMAWSPVCSLKRCLQVLEEVGRPNTGISIDYWHLWSGGETTPDELAKLDKNLICNIHFCDGKRPEDKAHWVDETILRAYYPGEGDIPLKEWTEAVKATGYDGPYSAELISGVHWQYDTRSVVQKLYASLSKYID